MEIFNNWLASNSTDRPILGVSDYKWRKKENMRNSLVTQWLVLGTFTWVQFLEGTKISGASRLDQKKKKKKGESAFPTC